jgi:hypothetical protein
MSSNKQSSVIHIRNWVRTNGDMSEDGKSITYSCKELEAIIEQAKAMHKEEIVHSYRCGAAEVGMIAIDKPEQYYNETFNQKQ